MKKPSTQSLVKKSIVPLVLAGLAQAACGSNGGTSDEGKGGDSSTGGSDLGGASGGGSKATGGSTTGGSGTGGEGGLGGEASTGGTNSGGTGGTIVVPDAITVLSTVTLTGVNDLRGLTYAASGKIYGSGHIGATASGRKIAVVRLNADGSFDTSFSDDGIVELDLAPDDQSEESLGIVELPSGELLVQANVSDRNGGTKYDDLGIDDGTLEDPTSDDQPRPHGVDVVLIKLTATGDLVESFGVDGVKKIDFGWTDADNGSWIVPTYDSTRSGTNKWSGAGFPNDQSWGLALDPSSTEEDPMVVVFAHGPAAKVSSGTQRVDNDRYIVRLKASDGSIDPAFNGGKAFTLNTIGTLGDGARRGIVEADGSIVSSGYTNFGAGAGNNIVIIRLKKNGTADASFDFGLPLPGAAVTNPFADDGGAAEAYAVAKQSSGRYVTTGYGMATVALGTSSYGYETSVKQDLVSFGLLPGKLDASYGTLGTLAIQSESYGLDDTEERGRDLVVLDDDRVVHAGRFATQPALFVTTKDGFLDSSVGDEGRLLYTAQSGTTSHFYRITRNASGTRVVASTANHADGVLVTVLKVGTE